MVVRSALFGLLLLTSAPAMALGESCLTAGCHAELLTVRHPHQPAADGECLACHAQASADHPAPGGKSFTLSADGSALCAPCHKVLSGAKFRHLPAQTGDCLACHRPHGGSEPALLTAPMGDLCFDCHDRSGFRQAVVHGPAASGECAFCHQPHESKNKNLLKGGVNELCLACHDDFAQQLKSAPVVHQPVKKALCTSCHYPHASPNLYVLKEKMPDICFGCHKGIDKKTRQAKVAHAPLQQEKSCSNCHSTHFSPAPGLLVSDEQSLCLSCHGVGNLGTPPLKNIKQELAKKKTLHGPLQGGECSACHDPHGADAFRLLNAPYPDGQYFQYQAGAYDFCLQCHQKNLLRFRETTLYTGFRDGKQNLHYVHVVEPRKGRTCRMCHEPHAGDGEKLIRQEGVPFGDWKIPIRFQSTPTGGSCSPGCHRPMEYDRNKAEPAKPGGRP